MVAPESKLPETMRHLDEKFDGREREFRRANILRGLKKGNDEMLKMTTRHLLRAPVMLILLTHREHGAPFLRALLSVLHEVPAESLPGVTLIHDQDSTKWGPFKHLSPSLRPDDEKKWHGLLSSQAEDVVHWWRQFGLNRECLVDDLQQLSSRNEPLPLPKGTAPLVAFEDK